MDDHSPERVVREAIERAASENARLIEQACEEALASGDHGVDVTYMNGLVIAAAPSPNVPYGHIHERHI